MVEALVVGAVTVVVVPPVGMVVGVPPVGMAVLAAGTVVTLHGGGRFGGPGRFFPNKRFVANNRFFPNNRFFVTGFGFSGFGYPWWWDWGYPYPYYPYPYYPYYGYDAYYGNPYYADPYYSYDYSNNRDPRFFATKTVQAGLAARGYYRGPIDGAPGPETRTAIRAFQAHQGLPVTGQIDGRLMNALRS